MYYLVVFLFFQEFENSKAVLEQKMADLQSELEEARNGQKDLKEISENREELQKKLSILESDLEQARIGHCNLKEIADKLELEKKELEDLKNQELSELNAKLESTEFGQIEAERHSLDIIDKLKAENETIKANSKTLEMSNQRLLTEKDEKLEHLEIQANNYAQMAEKLNVEIGTLKTEILVKSDEISSIQNQYSQLGVDYQTKLAEMEQNNQMSIEENCIKLQAEISRLNQALIEKENFLKEAYQTKLAEIEQNNQMSVDENILRMQAEISRLNQALAERENFIQEARNAIQEYETKIAVSISLQILFLLFIMWVLKWHIVMRC